MELLEIRHDNYDIRDSIFDGKGRDMKRSRAPPISV